MLLFIDEQGREIEFPWPEPGHPLKLHRYKQLSLSQPLPGEFCIATADEARRWHFTHQAQPGRWLLTAISDRHDNRLTLHYNAHRQPTVPGDRSLFISQGLRLPAAIRQTALPASASVIRPIRSMLKVFAFMTTRRRAI